MYYKFDSRQVNMYTIAGFVLLAGVINSSLYITTPRYVDQCVVTIDYNNTLDDTYPEKWVVMEKVGDYCKVNLAERVETVRFKIRYFFPDASVFLPTNDWIWLPSDIKRFESSQRSMDTWIAMYSIVLPTLLAFFILAICVLSIKKKSFVL